MSEITTDAPPAITGTGGLVLPAVGVERTDTGAVGADEE